MARPEMPSIPDDKLNFYREQLYRELSHMFKWEGLPTTIPVDYLERSLVRTGKVLFYEDDNIGLDVMQAEIIGYNRHNNPTTARATIIGTEEIGSTITRNIKRLTDSERAIDDFNPTTDGVLIYNMEQGKSSREIVEHYAERLALTQLAFDTNLLWQNRPYIFPVDNKDTKLSLEKLFHDIFTGKPYSVVDKQLFLNYAAGQDVGIKLDVPFIADQLLDTRNELMMHFRQTVGIDSAGVDKAERVGKFEVDANVQHTKTVLEIMLQQRQIAAENINAFFGLNVSVGVVGAEEMEEEQENEEEGEENGPGDSGAGEPTED